MDHIWEYGAVSVAPNPPSPASSGYPIEGLTPTTPGAWWFHMITEELRNTILAAGMTPSGTLTNQLAQAIATLAVQNATGGGGGGNGQAAYSVLTNPFTMPAINATAVAIVQNTTWLAIGAYVYIPGAGTLKVQGISGVNSMTLLNTGITGNATSGTLISTATTVVAAGTQGAQGIPGSGAYTTLTTAFTQPTAGGTVQVVVGSTQWMVVGQPIFITIGGNYLVSQVLDSQNVVLANVAGTANATAGSTIPSGAGVGSSGSIGPAGVPGSPGPGAYTNTTQSFNMPGVGSNVSISVGNAVWMVPGQTVYMQNAGYFQVSNVVNSQTAVIVNLGYANNVTPGTIVFGGGWISPAGVPGANGVQGVSAYSHLTFGFTQPAVGVATTIVLVNSAFVAVGQFIYVQNGGAYQVTTVVDGSTVTAVNLGTAGNAAPGTNVAAGGLVASTGAPGASGTGSGSVTGVSVVTANGFNGTVLYPNSTPTISVGTTISGLLMGSGGALVAAVAGTDYPSFSSTNNYTALQTYAAGSNYAGAASPLLLGGAPGSAGQVMISGGAGVTPSWTTLNFGTVTAVTVASANGFMGSVDTNTTTPVVTIIATPIGILKSNGTAISAANGGVDYAVPSLNNNWSAIQGFANGINLVGSAAPLQVGGSAGSLGQVLVSGGLGNSPVWTTPTTSAGTVTTVSVTAANGLTGTVANAGTAPAITLAATFSGIAKASTGVFSSAAAGTDYLAPNVPASIVALLSIVGTTAVPGISLTNGIEQANVVGNPPAATQTVYASSGQIVSFTQATANWVLNLTWSSTTTLSNAIAVNGGVATVSVWVPQGATAYYMTGLQIDGVGVTPVWMGSTGGPTAGHASSTDVYTFVVMRTGAGTYKVLAGVTQFK